MNDLRTRLASGLGDRYEIGEELGRGGMAVVHHARDLKHGRSVAIKVMKPEIAHSLGVQRFLREIEVAAPLSHPNILPIHDSGEADGLLYYVTPLVEGESLRARIARTGALPLDEAMRVTREIADALDYAHEAGVVHRDIKPENVLFQAGHAMVGDFGIARAVTPATSASLTETGVSIGTLAYMSPEQAGGDLPVDGRADVYSLGCIVYEMLTGERACSGATPEAVLASKLISDPPNASDTNPGVPDTVGDVIRTALAKDPERRPATAGALVEALAHASSERGIRERARRERRSRLARAAAAVVVVSASAGLGWWAFATLSNQSRIERMLVLPPTAPDGAEAADFLATGTHNALISALSRAGVFVIARPSTLQYGGSTRPMSEIAAERGVDAVILPTIEQRGDSVAMELRLIHGATDAQLWDATYQAPLGSLLNMHRAAVREILAEIDFSVSDEVLAQLTDRPTVSPAAMDAALKGFAQLEIANPRAADLAEQYFWSSIAADSGHAPAYVGLGRVWSQRLAQGAVPPQEARDSTLRLAERALALDSLSAEAHGLLAAYYGWGQRDYVAAEESYRRSMELDPSDSRLSTMLAHLLTALGREDEAAPIIAEAMARDPDNMLTRSLYGTQLMFAGEYEDAIPVFEDLLVRSPPTIGFAAHAMIGAYMALGRYDDAAGILTRLVRAMGDESFGDALDRAYAEGGWRQMARLNADTRARRFETSYQAPSITGLFYAEAGEYDQAFRWWNTAFEVDDHQVVYLGVHPAPTDFVTDSRYTALLERAGLPGYQRVRPGPPPT